MAGSFKSAFASARKAGKKAFTWNGKSYNTELAETVRPKPRSGNSGINVNDAGKNPKPASVGKVIRPKARPSSGGAMGAIYPKSSKESEGRAHIGRKRPAGRAKRGY